MMDVDSSSSSDKRELEDKINMYLGVIYKFTNLAAALVLAAYAAFFLTALLSNLGLFYEYELGALSTIYNNLFKAN